MFTANKKEVIPFREFMSRPALQPKETPLKLNIYSFIPTITLKGLLPLSDMGFTIFLIGGCAVVVFALSETLFAHTGYTEVSTGVSSFLKVVLPALGYGLIFWFFSTL